MKAAFYDRYGGPEVLRYGDVPEPKLAQTSVLIKVRAAALNPADMALQAGLGDSIMETWFPVIPGWDVAGVVQQVGAGVSEFQPGDEVLAFARQDILHFGTWAQYVSVPADLLARKPGNVSWEEAAGLPLAGLTALRGIRELNVVPGDTVLILGASGGVGAIATQLARNAGASVIGSASPGNLEGVAALGATPIRHDDLAGQLTGSAAKTVSAIFDCAGHGLIEKARAATRSSRVVSIASEGAGIQTIYARADGGVLEDLVDMMRARTLLVKVAASYPLSRAADAQRALAERTHGSGKIIVIPD